MYLNYKEINREASCMALLASQGIFPVKRLKNDEYMFVSPLRAPEASPSFTVRVMLNRWHDFGTGEDGSVIDLAIRLGLAADHRAAAEYLKTFFYNKDNERYTSIQSIPDAYNRNEPRVRVVSVAPLHSPALIDYLHEERCIPFDVAERYTKEVVYFNNGNGSTYYAIGFANRSGGFALRNKFFKGSTAPNDITFLGGKDNTTCLIFEGFVDFLSYVAAYGDPICDVFVLNSTSMASRVASKIAGYQKIFCFLDNDPAGSVALATIKSNSSNDTIILDKSTTYAGFNDLNDFWVYKYTNEV